MFDGWKMQKIENPYVGGSIPDTGPPSDHLKTLAFIRWGFCFCICYTLSIATLTRSL